MKKVLALLLSATLAVGCVAGCLTGCSDMTFDDDIYNDDATPEELGANPNAPEITLVPALWRGLSSTRS